MLWGKITLQLQSKIFLHPLQWKTSGTRSAKCHYVSLVMFLLKSSVVSSFHLKLYFLTTAVDLYKARLFHVTCLQLFSLHLRNNIQNKKQMYNLMLSPLLHQQDLRRWGSRECSSVCILAVPKASPGSMISPGMRGDMKGMHLSVRCVQVTSPSRRTLPIT